MAAELGTVGLLAEQNPATVKVIVLVSFSIYSIKSFSCPIISTLY
jgi:hypothetical protein